MKILWRYQGRGGSYRRSGSTSSLRDKRRSGKSDSKLNNRKNPAMVSSMISEPEKKVKQPEQPIEANMKKTFDSPGGVDGKFNSMQPRQLKTSSCLPRRPKA